MKIYLIRHGQTTGDLEDRYGGAYDDVLTDEGIIQTNELADKLEDSGIQILFCSPMKRAQQTTKILKDRLCYDMKIVDDLRERNKNGILTGMTRNEAKTLYPELVEQLKDYRSQIQGAESQEDFAKRIKKTFMEITDVSNYSTIAIVTHGMPFWVILGDIINDHSITNISDCAYAVLTKKDYKFSLDRSEGIEYKKEKSKVG